MSTKRQFKMYLSEDLVERLKHAADRIGKDSGQAVAEEILSIYLPVWTNVNDAMRRAIDFQSQLVVDAHDHHYSLGLLSPKADEATPVNTGKKQSNEKIKKRA